MRRTPTLAAIAASIAAAGFGLAATAQADTIEFGPGPLGAAYIGQSTVPGKAGYVNVNGEIGYTAPASVTGCSMYCATTAYVAASAYEGQQTGDGFSLIGQTADPLPYHAAELLYSTLSGPYLGYN
jgi:hypothetical protein